MKLLLEWIGLFIILSLSILGVHKFVFGPQVDHSLASQIDIKACVITYRQLQDLFSKKNIPPAQNYYRDLQQSERDGLFFILQVKNLNDEDITNAELIINDYEVLRLSPMPAKMNNFVTYVYSQAYPNLRLHNPNELDTPTMYRWRLLSAKNSCY